MPAAPGQRVVRATQGTIPRAGTSSSKLLRLFLGLLDGAFDGALGVFGVFGAHQSVGFFGALFELFEAVGKLLFLKILVAEGAAAFEGEAEPVPLGHAGRRDLVG